ncbi:hypothetical protein [Providencia heimbachae]|uniref:hypothetical protein n=1 Tax=Providencia heimbachae TaxID=333962 RepID=UPI001586DAA8
MEAIGFILILSINGLFTPVNNVIHTQQECESRASQLMQVRDVEIKCGEVFGEKTINDG